MLSDAQVFIFFVAMPLFLGRCTVDVLPLFVPLPLLVDIVGACYS